MRKINNKLSTEEINNLSKNCPLIEYPRMQFQRDSYLSLNGLWDYTISKNKNSTKYQGQILVPYCIESLNSGVQTTLKKGEYIIYHRQFAINKNFLKDITIINILGIDEEFDLIINNQKYENYFSLCLPLQINVSNSIKEGINDITIIVKDDMKQKFPRGKQTKKPKGMFYTPVSGIYYPIFIESYAQNHIESIKITTNLTSVNFKISTNGKYNLSIIDNDKKIYSISTDKQNITINIDSPHLWTPDNPYLYQVEISNGTDLIKSYFGLRTVEIKNQKVYLNNQEIFLNGILDQGYYPEGIYTVSTYNNYKKDILTAKELGFNLIRKHIKIENDYFYYLCDKYGILVLQDFVNNGKYNFFHDTFLPTIGFQKLKDNKTKNNETKNLFLIHCLKTQEYLYNHPSIIGYTIFNEGWGQFNADKIYETLKANDNTHLYDSTSGWFRQTLSDFESRHIYFKNITKNISKETKIIFLTEFGGYSYKIQKHSFNLKSNYGYKFFKTQENYEKEFINLYKEIIANKDKLVGAIYTQLNDVENETNGLLTYDRKILKVDKTKISNLMKELKK